VEVASLRHKSFKDMHCPIARSLEHVGDWWNILLIRDALHGLTRFEQFQKSLDIAPNILTRRLAALVDAGILERRAYSEHPPRHEYLLTRKGLDFRPVLLALLAWGNKHFADDGISVRVIDSATGHVAHPIVVDRTTREPLEFSTSHFAPGPAADDSVRRRLEFAATQRPAVLRRTRNTPYSRRSRV
jgi:DNA-binding HxlR family transcriptional regulator